MKQEKIYNRPLEEDEIILKNAYQRGDQRLWTSPMTYAEYERGCREGILVQTPRSYIYREKSIGKKGDTVADVESDSHVEVALHRRYSYPVLHNHDYVEIIYVAAGSCMNCFAKSSFPMNEGDVCFMAPQASHALSCLNDESCIVNLMVSRKFLGRNFLYMLKGGRLMADFLESVLYRRTISPYILFPTGKDPWLLELAGRILTEAKYRPHAYAYSISLLTGEFLLHITRDYEIRAIVPNTQGEAPNNLIISLLGYLSVNYTRTTLAEMAAFFGYSQGYLSRVIHENTGKTYNQIVTELQMEKAVELLREGNKSITEIAQEVGCFDSSHFNKKFKAVYGKSPGQYMEDLKKSG